MPKQVVYVGFGDTRVLGPRDLEQMGVERDETLTFHKGVPLEVVNPVADVLVRTGEYQVVEESEEAVQDSAESPDDDASESDATAMAPEDQAGN